MSGQFSRTEMLIGSQALEKLSRSVVAVFGIGGVGGYVCEALARAGIGSFELIDNDIVSVTNINRQIIALHSTVGRQKTAVMAERIADINPEAKVRVRNLFFLPENKAEFDFSSYDYVVDAVDTVTAKIALIEEAKRAGVPVISSMGTGNKLCPAMLEVADISKTSVCPLAKVMRYELKKRGISGVKAVYSKEIPIKPAFEAEDGAKRSVPGSISFVPPAAGLIIASEVIKDLIGGAEI